MSWWNNAEGVLGGPVATVPTAVDVVSLEGPDALAYTHRMCTAAVADLAVGQAALACFTDKKGRLRGCGVCLRPGEEQVQIFAPAAADDGALARYLDGFLFAEQLELSARCEGATSLIGPGAAAVVGVAMPPPFGAVRAGDGTLVRWFDLAPDGEVPWCWWVPDNDAAALVQAESLPQLEADRLEALRVAAGVPGPAELSPEHNPLELALHDAIAWDKGCYPGQEVIARIDNYDKQSRHLVALEGHDIGRLFAGDPLLGDDDKVLGTVTSVSPMSDLGGPCALALVRSREPFDKPVKTEGGAAFTTRQRLAAQVPHD